MAGGTWIAQNKVRPGAYINFKAVNQPQSSVGTRGVVALPLATPWGAKVTEVLSTDMTGGKILEKLGGDLSDEFIKPLKEALSHAYKAIVYRTNHAGINASGVLGEISMQAKYPGTAGNEITVSVLDTAAGMEVVTHYRGSEVDRQIAEDGGDLVDNDYVMFDGVGALEANAGITLEGGLINEVGEDVQSDYLGAIAPYHFDTAVVQPADTSQAGAAVAFVTEARENQGKKFQIVGYNLDADYEGVISTKAGFKRGDDEVGLELFPYYMAGLTAGTPINESNTYHAIPGATEIIYDGETFTHEDYIEALKGGYIVLSTRQDGTIVIEQDLNTLRSYGANKNRSFAKNRVIRVLDEVHNTVRSTFESNYIGKVDNTDAGRNVFKADLLTYFESLQTMGAITNFDSSTDVEVLPGQDIDSVVANVAIQPVDSMEKLYMTVVVG